MTISSWICWARQNSRSRSRPWSPIGIRNWNNRSRSECFWHRCISTRGLWQPGDSYLSYDSWWVSSCASIKWNGWSNLKEPSCFKIQDLNGSVIILEMAQKILGHDLQGNPGISLAMQAINWISKRPWNHEINKDN